MLKNCFFIDFEEFKTTFKNKKKLRVIQEQNNFTFETSSRAVSYKQGKFLLKEWQTF